MVALYVGGNKIGTLADAEKLLPEFASYRQEIEFRDAAGVILGRFVPEPICPWEPDLTKEEIDRRIQEPGAMTLADFWKKMGVQ